MNRFAKYLLRVILVLFILINGVLALHAYKFTHFYNRDEVAVKNEKNKTAWDKTKDFLFGFTFVKQANSVPDSSFETVYLKTKNGLKLEAWYRAVPNANGTVAMFHGHGGTKSGIVAEAAAFRSLGYNTFLLDFRAHGNSEGNTCTIGYREAEDVKLAYDFLRQHGHQNVILWGISLGAATITKSIYDYDLTPEKVILEMPFGSMMDAVKGRMKIMKLPAEPLATMLAFWGGLENGFWAYGLKPTEYVKRIKCPVLLQRGKLDPRVTQEETDQIYANIATAKTLMLYDSCGHESLYKKEPLKWKSAITSFLAP